MKDKPCSIEWSSQAVRQYKKINDPSLANKILDIIEKDIAFHPLKGKPLAAPFKGVRSYRIGVLRILYKFYKQKVLIVILRIDHRGQVYRKFS